MRGVHYDAPTSTAPRDATRAVVVEDHGGPESLIYRNVGRPEPGPGQVRIATELGA